MNADVATIPPEADSVSRHWDQLWRHAPSTERDDALLDRERRSPRWRSMRERITAHFGSIRGLRTIELGSGRGDWSALLAEQGAEVTLLDTSNLALEQARKRFDRLGLAGRFEQGDLFDPNVHRKGAYDVSLSSGVIEHFAGETRSRAIAAHVGAVVPGGLCVISVPHAWCPTYRLWKLYLELRGCWPYGREIPYTRSELSRRARESGLTDIRVDGFGFWQSASGHVGRGMLGMNWDASDRRSSLDRWMGVSLVLLGAKGR